VVPQGIQGQVSQDPQGPRAFCLVSMSVARLRTSNQNAVPVSTQCMDPLVPEHDTAPTSTPAQTPSRTLKAKTPPQPQPEPGSAGGPAAAAAVLRRA
jgi:hypothetical protein